MTTNVNEMKEIIKRKNINCKRNYN